MISRTSQPQRAGVALTLALLSGATWLLSGCGGSSSTDAPSAGETAPTTELTVYSGRNERLVGPLLQRFQDQTGIVLKTRYLGSSELAATLLEEGVHSPADVFISQDAASLGAVSKAGLLKVLPDDLTGRVRAELRSDTGDWVGLSGRARSVVYNPERIQPDALPQSLGELTDPKYRGRFGVAPTNASFQAHMASVYATEGADALKQLLDGIVANEPLRYPKNTPIVDAVIRGEIDFGLVNHYYLLRALAENPDAPGKNFFMKASDVSGFVNLAGVGILKESDASNQLVEFLLSDEAQNYFASETFEYPLIPGAKPTTDLPSLESFMANGVDFRQLADALEPSIQAIRDSGLTRFE